MTKSKTKKPAKMPNAKPGCDKILPWKNVQWYSNAKHWNAEFKRRLDSSIYSPYENPKTKKPYTNAAQRYRDKFIVIIQNLADQS